MHRKTKTNLLLYTLIFDSTGILVDIITPLPHINTRKKKGFLQGYLFPNFDMWYRFKYLKKKKKKKKKRFVFSKPFCGEN